MTEPVTEGDIQKALYRHCMVKQHRLAIPNVYMFGMNESDLLSVSRSGYVQEFEVKVSRADFKADFKKNRHLYYQREDYTHGPAYFSYVAPEGIIEVGELPEYAGLLHYIKAPEKSRHLKGQSYVTVVKPPKRFRNSQKLSMEQCLSLCSKLSFRYWNKLMEIKP